MKKLLILVNFTAYLMYSSNAVAFNYMYGWYVHGQGGLSYLRKIDDNKNQRSIELYSKPTYNFGGSLGYRFDQFRTDFSSHFTKTRIRDVNTQNGDRPITSLTNSKEITGSLRDFIINGYYDLSLDGPVKLVFGAGAGYGHAKLHYLYDLSINPKTQEFKRSYNLFIYNAVLGFHLILNHMWDVSFEYRFYSTFSQKVGKIADGNFFESSMNFHSLDLGILLKLS